jgi:hypothetical protein
MKKITLLLFLSIMFSFSGQAQCLTATYGLYPADTYTPLCDGLTVGDISTNAWAGEFSNVNVTAGQTYSFRSSVATDYLTISNADGTSALASGVTPLTYVATATAVVRFYTHTNATCGSENVARARRVFCGIVPTCLAPTALTGSAITTNSATISWTASTTVPSAGYQYYLSTSATAPTATTVPTGTVATGTSANLAGLTSGTNYFVWVRSNCGSGDISGWSASYNFATACSVTGDFTEGFENTALSTVMPVCWNKKIVSSSTNSYVYVSGSDANTGVKALRMGNSDAATAVLFAITPNLTDLPSQNHRLKFFAKGDATITFQVGTMTNPADESTFVLKQTLALTATHQQFVINFDTPVTGNYIAFRAQYSSTYYYVSIDDVIWEPIPTCLEPTAVVSSAITSSSANIAWTASPSAPASGYQYYLSTTNVAPTATTTPTGSVATGTSVALSALTSNTLYYVWVRSNCGSSTSPWTNVASFRTLCAATAAPLAAQDFATYLPACWSEATGALGTSTTLTGTSSSWLSNNFANFATGTDLGVKINLYGGSTATPDNDWVITNPIDLGSTPGQFRLKYKIAVTSYNGVDAQTTLGTHTVRVVVSTDGGATWSTANVIKTYTGAGTYSNTGQDEIVNLAAYSGVVKIGFLSTTTSTSPDIDFHIDNFTVESLALSAPSFDTANFRAYPNPVKNILNLSYTQEMSDVAVFNLLGQQVLSKKVNATESQIDMSNLPQGTYLVKVTVDNQVKTIKVMKQ